MHSRSPALTGIIIVGYSSVNLLKYDNIVALMTFKYGAETDGSQSVYTRKK